MSDALAELEKKALHELRRERPRRRRAFPMGIDEFLQIGVQKLEDEVKDGL